MKAKKILLLLFVVFTFSSCASLASFLDATANTLEEGERLLLNTESRYQKVKRDIKKMQTSSAKDSCKFSDPIYDP